MRRASIKKHGPVNVSILSSSGKSLQPEGSKQKKVMFEVSIPSSSGKSLQPRELPTSRAPYIRLNPLFIGEVSSTKRCPRASHVGCFRLNPLFIGEVSSTVPLSPHPEARISVSIPSSSGKSLQLKRLVTNGHLVLESQSPLHRGSLFNKREFLRGMLKARCLNPLFIGEVSSTHGALDPVEGAVWVSIPSSSGKSLQLGSVSYPYCAGYESQSPLHRGSLFNTHR